MTPSMDCCKPPCAWPRKANVSNPVRFCDIDDASVADYHAQSACDSGTTYMYSSQTPWTVNDTFAYGSASVVLSGGTGRSGVLL
ncbi:glycoside hydrolase family 45 protein [Viridothelium virens]|uniref:cellulase n=1 Tax=Viridothelium virens TaxID=1048519 RepID=A0A6A6H6C5_VIRVR|nr:glycoside hydrolase family 45 protein [Viridothelium virens]